MPERPAHLPHDVAAADVLARLDEGERVPDGGAAGVAEVVQRVGGRRLLLAAELQLLADALHHAAAAWQQCKAFLYNEV